MVKLLLVTLLLSSTFPHAGASLFGSSSSKDRDKDSNEGDNPAPAAPDEPQQDPNKDHLMLLNDDGETGGEGQQQRKQGERDAERYAEDFFSTDDEPFPSEEAQPVDEALDKMPHSKQPNPAPGNKGDSARTVSLPFEEFTREPSGDERVLDPKAEALYNAAVETLAKRRWSEVVQRDLRTAYMDLEEAAQLGHPDAEKLLAYSYLFGDYRWSIDEARQLFEKLAAQGSPDAHLALGFLHSTGVGVQEPNTARGLLHYTFAAVGGSPLAQMALGYRYGYGISATQNCEAALMWYERVATKVAKKVKLTGTASTQRIRIPDELEATQGASSSVVSSTLLDSNVFSYYKYLAETGDMQATASHQHSS